MSYIIAYRIAVGLSPGELVSYDTPQVRQTPPHVTLLATPSTKFAGPRTQIAATGTIHATTTTAVFIKHKFVYR